MSRGSHKVVIKSDDDIKIDEKVNLYLFWGSTCPHCKAEYAFLESLSDEEKSKFRVYGFEVWNNKENASLMKEFAKITNKEVTGVPYLVIGDSVITGYSDDATTGKDIKDLIDKLYTKTDRTDVYKLYQEQQ